MRNLAMCLLAPLIGLWVVWRHGVRIVVAESPYEGVLAVCTKNIAKLLGFRVAVVVESHGDFETSIFMQRRVLCVSLYRRLMKAAATFSIERADVLRAISGFTRAQLEEWNSSKPLVQFPTWTDLDVFLQAGEEPVLGHKEILYAGVLIPRKGVHFLIEAFARLAREHPEVDLVLVGSAPNPTYLDELRSLIRALQLEDRIRFIGNVTQIELARRMRSAFVFVLPSTSEGLGRVVFEAMACGTPVVGSRTGGIPEMIVDGAEGLLTTPGDPCDLERCLRWILDHPEDANKMGKRGRARAREIFSVEGYISSYKKVFDVALSCLEA